MTIEAMGEGLVTRLETISTLKGRSYAPNALPGSVNSTPAALVIPGLIEYDLTFGGAVRCNFRVVLLFARTDQVIQYDKMLPYLETTGDYSVYAAIFGDDTLGGAADFSIIKSNTGLGFTEWGGMTFCSSEWLVECQRQ
ncbi:MAG: hypothetical protein M0Q12_07680 [Synergistaceae bacterium]|jgi:hypothetical protein|nr:hypothetical protein [Synergistaceae bacterium]